MGDQQASYVYDLMRRVPPSKVENRLYDCIELCPDLTDTLLSTIDTPLKVETDTEANVEFIACEFNRDLDSHRSPISNHYFPPLPDGQELNPRLRKMEQKANTAFNAYRHLYFQGGICSVYLWEIDENIFGFGIFIKNPVDTQLRDGAHFKGCIDCTDTIEVDESTPGQAKYSLTSSVILNAELDIGLSAPLNISGSTADRKEKTASYRSDDDHIINIGQFVEKNSANFRDKIQSIYIEKMKQILNIIAHKDGNSIQDMMAKAFQARQGK